MFWYPGGAPANEEKVFEILKVIKISNFKNFDSHKTFCTAADPESARTLAILA